MNNKEWIKAKGSCGLNIGKEDVYCAYVNGVALFAFKSPLSSETDPFYTCVVTGEMSVGGATLKDVQDSAYSRAISSNKSDRDRSITKSEFDMIVNDTKRLSPSPSSNPLMKPK